MPICLHRKNPTDSSDYILLPEIGLHAFSLLFGHTYTVSGTPWPIAAIHIPRQELCLHSGSPFVLGALSCTCSLLLLVKSNMLLMLLRLNRKSPTHSSDYILLPEIGLHAFSLLFGHAYTVSGTPWPIAAIHIPRLDLCLLSGSLFVLGALSCTCSVLFSAKKNMLCMRSAHSSNLWLLHLYAPNLSPPDLFPVPALM